MHGSSALPPGRTLRLRRGRYDALTRAKGWHTQEEQARGLGLAQPTISRTLKGPDVRGGQAPSSAFIATLLAVFPGEKFEDLFEVVEDEDASPLRRAS